MTGPTAKILEALPPWSRQCFALLREVSTAPVIDLSRLLDAVVYNFLVGNNDAHGKNFSLLYYGVGTANQQTRLAPLYDVVSTTYYPELSKEMAMKIGRQYSSDKVTPKDFEQLAKEAGLAKPMVKSRVLEITETVIDNLDQTGVEHPVGEAIAALIRKRCEMVRSRFRN